jgi:hypothetical protein
VKKGFALFSKALADTSPPYTPSERGLERDRTKFPNAAEGDKVWDSETNSYKKVVKVRPHSITLSGSK